ncbi:MAG: GNAT family N-acetyltransferase, partial [Burkholderiaceae bacterium]
MSKPEPVPGPIVFQVCTTDSQLQASFAVRAIVFIEEQACPFADEFDELDRTGNNAIHIVGTVAAEPVAAGRIRRLPDVAKLERLSIRQAWRGRGAGHQLLKFMMQSAQVDGYHRFKLNAQAHLTGFY